MAFSQGAYTFKIQAAGGLRLWVDGRLEIDAWDAQGAFIEHQAKVALDGGLHRLEVEYVNRTGGAALVFVDLPPNPPLPVDLPVVRYTRGLTAPLSWLDTGDADGSANGAPRKFTVSVGREDADGSPREILNSDWLTTTSWRKPDRRGFRRSVAAHPPVTGGKKATSAPSSSAADSSLMTWFNARRTARSRDRLSA